MKKYITIAALLAAGSAFANADVAWDAVKEQYLIETDSWSNGAVTLGGEGFDLSQTEWIISTTISINPDDGANEWGTRFLATSLTTELFDSNTFMLYSGSKKTSNYQKLTIRGFNFGTAYDYNPDALGTTDDLLMTAGVYTFDLVRDSDSITLNVYSVSGEKKTLVSQTTKDATDINGTIKTLYSGVNLGKAGWTMPRVTLSYIPEPSAFGLLAGLGALALVGTRRRRR